MNSDATSELLQAILAATPAQKKAALRVLRGAEEEPKAPEIERYLTLREVARKLGVSACSLWRWGVPGHELGGRRKFRLSEVTDYLESDAFKARADTLRAERREA